MKIIRRKEAEDAKARQVIVSDNAELEQRERAFVSKLLSFAEELGIDLAGLTEINVTSLTEAAKSAGASSTKLVRMQTELQTICFDMAACSDGSWKEIWASFKTRIPIYIHEMTAQK